MFSVSPIRSFQSKMSSLRITNTSSFAEPMEQRLLTQSLTDALPDLVKGVPVVAHSPSRGKVRKHDDVMEEWRASASEDSSQGKRRRIAESNNPFSEREVLAFEDFLAETIVTNEPVSDVISAEDMAFEINELSSTRLSMPALDDTALADDFPFLTSSAPTILCDEARVEQEPELFADQLSSMPPTGGKGHFFLQRLASIEHDDGDSDSEESDNFAEPCTPLNSARAYPSTGGKKPRFASTEDARQMLAEQKKLEVMALKMMLANAEQELSALQAPAAEQQQQEAPSVPVEIAAVDGDDEEMQAEPAKPRETADIAFLPLSSQPGGLQRKKTVRERRNLVRNLLECYPAFSCKESPSKLTASAKIRFVVYDLDDSEQLAENPFAMQMAMEGTGLISLNALLSFLECHIDNAHNVSVEQLVDAAHLIRPKMRIRRHRLVGGSGSKFGRMSEVWEKLSLFRKTTDYTPSPKRTYDRIHNGEQLKRFLIAEFRLQSESTSDEDCVVVLD